MTSGERGGSTCRGPRGARGYSVCARQGMEMEVETLTGSFELHITLPTHYQRMNATHPGWSAIAHPAGE